MSFWVILVSSIFAAVYANPACDPEIVKKCGLTMDDSNRFPTNALDLKQQCDNVEPKFKCIADFMARCPIEIPMGGREYFNAVIEITRRICRGDLNDKYLRNAQCFGDVMTTKQPFCDSKYNTLIVEKGICAYKDAVTKCVAAFVETCGKEALDLYYEFGKVTKYLFIEDSKVCP